MKHIVRYALDYKHIVEVGVDASNKEEAEQIAESAFDAGTIWDDTPTMPLLYDDFDESESAGLVFEATPVVGDWPTQDASVTSKKATDAAWNALRALNEFAQARSRAGQSIRPSELIHLVGNYLHPFAGASDSRA